MNFNINKVVLEPVPWISTSRVKLERDVEAVKVSEAALKKTSRPMFVNNNCNCLQSQKDFELLGWKSEVREE